MKQRSLFLLICCFGSLFYFASFYGFVSRHLNVPYYDVTAFHQYENLTLVVAAVFKSIQLTTADVTSRETMTKFTMTPLEYSNETNKHCLKYFTSDCNTSVVSTNQSRENYDLTFSRRSIMVKSLFTKLPDHFAKVSHYVVTILQTKIQ